MKASIILIGVLMLQSVMGQFGAGFRPAGPGFRPVGPGFRPVGPGFRQVGGFGLREVGVGAVAPFPTVAPVAAVAPVAVVPVTRTVLVPVGGVGFRPAFGKRDTTAVAQPEVTFWYSTEEKLLELAIGKREKIGCDVEARLSRPIKLRLVDLAVVKLDKDAEIYSLASSKSSPNDFFTYMDPSLQKPVILSFYSDASITKPGFLIKNELCFKSIVEVLKTDLVNTPVQLVVV